MGYYTNYDLGIRPIGEGKSWLRAYDSEENKKFMEIVEDLNKSCDVCFDEYGWQEDSNFDWEKDLTEFSKKYPDFFFELEGRGDEWDDHWKAIFWNGRYRAENYITIDPDLKLEMLQDGYQEPFKNYNVVSISKEDIFAYARSDKNMSEEEAQAFVNSFTDEEMQDIANTLSDIVFDTIAFGLDLAEAIETTLSNRVALEKK